MAISTATTAGQILTSAYVNNNINSGLVYVTEGTFSASSAVNVAGCFTTTSNNYRIILQIDTVNSDATRTINMRFRDSGGDDAGAVYTYGSQMSFFGSTSFDANNSGYSQTAFKLCSAYYSTEIAGASIDVLHPFVASKKTMIGGTVQGGTASANTTGIIGGFTTAKSYTGFSIYPSTGTITGTYYVYAYRNA